jgi:hypothetical protein
MPREPSSARRVRLYNKLIDEYVHNSCTILPSPPLSGPWFAGLSGEQIEAAVGEVAEQAAHRVQARTWRCTGLQSKFVRQALDYHLKLLKMMDEALQPLAPGSPASSSPLPTRR